MNPLLSWTPLRRAWRQRQAADRLSRERGLTPRHDFELRVRQRSAWLVPVQQPMILIAQVQRSGGTLLTRLFDGHDELFVHPYQLEWGRPTKDTWPDLDLSGSARSVFLQLDERWVSKLLRGGGYSKDPAGTRVERHPFVFDQPLERRLFETLFRAGRPARQRDALNMYLTVLFNAWLDYQSLYRGPKKYVTAFAPGVNARSDSVDRFWRDYPDGYLLSVIRNPASWFASARRLKSQRPKFTTLDLAMQLWRTSVEGTLAAAARQPDRVIGVLFEDLVRQPRLVLERICERTGVTFAPGLLIPTYNGRPVTSDSSFDPQRHIDGGAADRSHGLTAEEATRIARLAGDVHARARERWALS